MKVDAVLNYKVFIKSAEDDSICIRANDKGAVDYVKGAKGPLETFIITKVGEDQYAIQTHYKTYLYYREGSRFHSAKLLQGEKTIGDMERFKFIYKEDNKSYLIQTPAGTFVRLGDGVVTLSSQGDAPGSKERFHIGLALPDNGGSLNDCSEFLNSLAFQSYDKTSYIRGARNDAIDVQSKTLGPWELFELVPQDDDDNGKKFAIQNIHFKKYMRARKKNPEIDQSDEIGPWEKFEFLRYDHRCYVIRTAHDTYLGIDGDQIKHYPLSDPSKQLFHMKTKE